jgi:translation initiation factor 2-alpha kinase 4
MYSLGVSSAPFEFDAFAYEGQVVFFEMNYKFNTASERVAVLQQLRQPQILFPRDFSRPQQKELITWLLHHDPSNRPTAAEVLRSPHMPQQMEDAYFAQASRLMGW